MATPALSFPRDWPGIVRPHFLLGVPIVGAQEAVYHDLCAQLALRTEDSWREWGSSDSRLSLARFAAMALGRACHWPKPIFVPTDPFVLMAWDYSTCGGVDHGDVDEALQAIASRVGLDRNSVEWNRFENATFGEVVEFLLSHGSMALGGA